MSTENIFECRCLKKHFTRNPGFIGSILNRNPEPIKAVDGVSFTLKKGDSIGIIGESGCGKTTLIKTLMGLHEPTDGEIQFNGDFISEFTKEDWMEYRRNVQIIFQDPFKSMDPKFTVKDTLQEPLEIHNIKDKKKRIRDVLNTVELQPVNKYLNRLPEQLSGGEKQRVSIARALILNPSVILADEPVSMLDVSTQAAILQLLRDLVNKTDIMMIYISHDLSTVSYVAERINVMYLGRIIERGPAREIIQDPKHPYVQSLVNAIPVPDPYANRKRSELEGSPSDPIGLGDGCRFRDRCPERMDVCEITPEDVEVENGDNTAREVACHLYYDHENDIENPQE